MRTGLGLTQVEVARRARTTQSAIARAESGQVVPSIELLVKLAKAMRLRWRLEIEPLDARHA